MPSESSSGNADEEAMGVAETFIINDDLHLSFMLILVDGGANGVVDGATNGQDILSGKG